ncbi:MAG: HAMP domain-containing protein [Desulfovibrionaceae bacterium]|nr:HAMP domain-containing protein [Desulfovibrionaceae bacterium]MBF0513693.1 HAMP domain-containing protein [Desulfovibrionaceae bacterium]
MRGQGPGREGVRPGKPGFFPWSVSAKLVASFCSLFTVVLCLMFLAGAYGIPLTRYPGRIGLMKAEAFRGLELIADLKRSRLVNWLNERADDARQLASLDIVRKSPALAGPRPGDGRPIGSDPALQNVLDSTLRSLPIYTGICLVDAASRRIVVSTDPKELGASLAGRRFVEGALTNRSGYLGGVDYSPASGLPAFFASHAVLDSSGAPVAVLVMGIDAEDIIRPMLHLGDGLGERGEALLVDQQGRILTSLKFPLAAGSSPKPLEYRVTDQPAILAASGEEGTGESVDYRGQRVLAAYRHVRLSSDEGWGLVVKRDEAELLAATRGEAVYSALVALGGLAAVVAATVLLSRRLTRPIRELDAVAREIAAGKTGVRAKTASGDETGRLALAFNSMLDKLHDRRAALEAAVAGRTAALDLANKALVEKIADLERAGEKIAAQLTEKEVLLKEVHHRVKNNLQIISSLLSLQAVHVLDPRDKELFEDSVGRVISMAMVHEDLYATKDFTKIGLREYAEKLSRRLAANRFPGGAVRLEIRVADILLPVHQAIPCGLIINELVTNAFKHAFPGGRAGTIDLSLRETEGGYELRVADDGVGLAADFDWKKTQTLGLTLVTSLAGQLHGEATLSPGGGAAFSVTFPR